MNEILDWLSGLPLFLASYFLVVVSRACNKLWLLVSRPFMWWGKDDFKARQAFWKFVLCTPTEAWAFVIVRIAKAELAVTMRLGRVIARRLHDFDWLKELEDAGR